MDHGPFQLRKSPLEWYVVYGPWFMYKQTWLPKTESHVGNMWIELTLKTGSFWFLFYFSLYWASFCPLKNLHIYYTTFLAKFQVYNQHIKIILCNLAINS
jgi:hypothetical protein